MCGIAGFFGQRPIAPVTRQAMLRALRQRGPDAQHEHCWNTAGDIISADQSATAGMLHARLSIRDPRPIADQPMHSADGQISICYNGEIYGWEDQRESLEACGAVFHTSSDTEFILRAYEAWGLDALIPRLRGMFAIAILDRRIGKLFLLRDRMGLKPMVYSHGPDGIAFGSTVRSVLPWLPQDQRAFSQTSIDAYLAHRYIPAPATIFQHIQRLPNGHVLTYSLNNGSVDIRRYWAPVADGSGCVETALATLDEAVSLRTVADRPLGVFLSGGIDSSCVASRLAAQQRTELCSFTASFPGTKFDESSDAAEIAQTLGLNNLALPIPTQLGDDFERIVADLDEPFADPSSFPTWYLSRETVKHVTVILGGDGGDEVFAGYKRHPKHMKQAWRGSFTLPLPSISSPAAKGLGKLVDELRLSWQDAYTLRFSGFTPAQRRWLSGDRVLPKTMYWRTPDVQESAPVKQLLALDFANTLPEYILRKADLCTMAHGLEMRAPLLDHVWLGELFALQDQIRFTQPAKYLLAQAMPQLAPLDLFNRKKRGFNPPLTGWLRNDLNGRFAGLGERLEQLTDGWLDAARIDQFSASYLNGQEALAETILQLLILDESLAQLDVLRSNP
ncbi:asparagine synthase (glutamine-hydrolyzing) [Burkholderiaceae bacterium DAT-1]|nr:asparagine synthase (glutamine-hydrolyzing) [Burkholderiaceae bacterium DAT-1]